MSRTPDRDPEDGLWAVGMMVYEAVILDKERHARILIENLSADEKKRLMHAATDMAHLIRGIDEGWLR